MLRYESTDQPEPRPKRLKFGVLSTKDIRRTSVCKVTSTTLYYRGLPSAGGLLDPSMGTVSPFHLCATCQRSIEHCQGHPGHIELAWPLYNLCFLDTTIKVLRCVCFACSRLCAPCEAPECTSARANFARLTTTASKVGKDACCPHCGMPRPSSYTRTPYGIRVEWPAGVAWESEEEREYCTRPFTARDALSILDHITDSDCVAFGFDPSNSHPRDLICEVLPVPPPCARPAIYSSVGSRSRGQNELTVRYIEILRRNAEVQDHLAEGETWRTARCVDAELVDRVHRLQYEYFLLINNSVRVPKPPGMGRSGGSTSMKSITQRIKGKEGRVRGNLMGKRTNFSARAVITPDAYFECDRIGVPHEVALQLTIPEMVNAHNIDLLGRRVDTGSGVLGGAETILHRDGSVTHLPVGARKRRARGWRASPAARDVVERYLQDDDVVLFNRQPRCHAPIQAHRGASCRDAPSGWRSPPRNRTMRTSTATR